MVASISSMFWRISSSCGSPGCFNALSFQADWQGCLGLLWYGLCWINVSRRYVLPLCQNNGPTFVTSSRRNEVQICTIKYHLSVLPNGGQVWLKISAWSTRFTREFFRGLRTCVLLSVFMVANGVLHPISILFRFPIFLSWQLVRWLIFRVVLILEGLSLTAWPKPGLRVWRFELRRFVPDPAFYSTHDLTKGFFEASEKSSFEFSPINFLSLARISLRFALSLRAYGLRW